jgi:hypothetical protein
LPPGNNKQTTQQTGKGRVLFDARRILLWLLAASAAMQVSAEFAAVLQSCGLLVNSMGGETQLDLATYTFSGGDAV